MLDVYESVDSAVCGVRRFAARIYALLVSSMYKRQGSIPRSPILKVSCLLFCRLLPALPITINVLVCIDFILVLLFTAELRLFHCGCHLTRQLVCW